MRISKMLMLLIILFLLQLFAFIAAQSPLACEPEEELPPPTTVEFLLPEPLPPSESRFDWELQLDLEYTPWTIQV